MSAALPAAVCALLLGLGGGQDPDSGADPLQRDLTGLPRAAPGTWDDWRPDAEIQETHREALGAGLRAYSARDYAATLLVLYDLLEREPDYPPALYQAATTHFRLRRYGDCAFLLERFLEVVPHEVGATQALGHSLYTLGRYDEARAHYERVLAVNPNSVEAVRGQALTCLRLGENARGLELLERTVELRPAHAEAHAWIAHVHFDEGRLREARAACERSIELDASRPRPWFILSGILGELGEDEAALEARARFDELSRLQQELLAAEAVLLREPRNPAVVAAVVRLQVQRGDARGVREALRRLIALDPASLPARILALDSFEALGDAEAARLAAFDLETNCPERIEAWQRLESYWASVGDITRQIQSGERHRRMRAGTPGEPGR